MLCLFLSDCRGESDRWVTSNPPWELYKEGLWVTDFKNPGAYFVGDAVEARPILYERQYRVKHGGAPIQVLKKGASLSSTILTTQYIQVFHEVMVL